MARKVISKFLFISNFVRDIPMQKFITSSLLALIFCIHNANAGIISYSETVTMRNIAYGTYLIDSTNTGTEHGERSSTNLANFAGFDSNLGTLQSVNFSWSLEGVFNTYLSAQDTVADRTECYGSVFSGGRRCYNRYDDITTAAAWNNIDIELNLEGLISDLSVYDKTYSANYSGTNGHLSQTHNISESSSLTFGSDSFFNTAFQSRVNNTIISDLFCSGISDEMMCRSSGGVLDSSFVFTATYYYEELAISQPINDSSSVPVPAPMALICLGFLGLGLLRKKV